MENSFVRPYDLGDLLLLICLSTVSSLLCFVIAHLFKYC